MAPHEDALQKLLACTLTTAEILYRMPDHPSLLQTYIWQDYDLLPRFPKLRRFLDFWSHNLEGQLHRITVAHKGLVQAADMQFVNGELRLH